MNTPITTPGPPDDDQEEPWRRRPDENNLWYSRFSAYLSAGPMRTKLGVYHAEGDQEGLKGTNNSKSLPRSWRDAAKRFDWKARAEAYDAWRRKEVFSEGLAQDTERVKRLVELAERMYAKLMTEFDTMAVNDKFMAQLLAVFDLLAKHTGGYAAVKHEITGKDGGKIEIEETMPQVVFYMPEIDFSQLDNGPQVVDSSPAETTKDNEKHA